MGSEKPVSCLVVDTTAFIQNAQLQNVAETIITCPEVVEEIKSKRQLKRLIVLPYDLVVKEAFPENIHFIREFAKKTGDYPSLSATDITVMALTYQLEKEKVGTEHIRQEPLVRRAEITTENKHPVINTNEPGFYLPKKTKNGQSENNVEEIIEDNPKEKQTEGSDQVENHLDEKDIIDKHEDWESDEDEFEDCNDYIDVLVPVLSDDEYESSEESEDDDDGKGWITPSNIKQIRNNSKPTIENKVAVACMTTDFAMQNVLRQMNLNVSALDGRLIKHLRTYILRCYACFKTTSIMTKKFCPKCGNDTLKKVAVSLDEDGKLQIHINARRPLTARGKKYSLPKIRGGKHPNNPILVADQPMPDNKPSRLARMKNNPLNDEYIAGVSPFLMRDINSKSAQLCIRPGQEFKHWMRKNPNEARRKRK